MGLATGLPKVSLGVSLRSPEGLAKGLVKVSLGVSLRVLLKTRGGLTLGLLWDYSGTNSLERSTVSADTERGTVNPFRLDDVQHHVLQQTACTGAKSHKLRATECVCTENPLEGP